MSALFGHVKGAFTGATTDRPGLLRAADGGMLFLDEIGELGIDEQAMFLRAVEEKHFLPVGSDREVESEFQLSAGTRVTFNHVSRTRKKSPNDADRLCKYLSRFGLSWDDLHDPQWAE